MKKILALLLITGLYSCGSHSPNANDPAAVVPGSKSLNPDTLTARWIASFRMFRDAVYHHEPDKVKRFFKFPVMNDNNHIWSLVLTDSEKNKRNIGPDSIVPFTEKDFDV